MRNFIIFLSLNLVVPAMSWADPGNGASGQNPYQHLNEIESRTQVDDQTATAAFKASYNKLMMLASKRANTRAEPVLLAQAAELLKKMAAIQFRLIHRFPNNSQNQRAEYKKTLTQLLDIENRLVQKYPKSPDVPRYYFLRASALKELGRETEAIQNLKYLIDNFPNNEDYVNSQLTLYELLSQAKDYRSAIQYHLRLLKYTTSPFYHLILNNLAFAYFYINDIPTALHYLELELARFPPKAETNGEEYSERGKILKNAVLFYFTGISNRLPNFTTHSLIPYLRGLNPGPSLGPMFKYLANLIRARGRDADIETLKYEVLTANLNLADTLEFVIIAFDNELNKKDYSHIRETTELLNKLDAQMGTNRKSDRERIHRILGTASLSLQQAYLKSQGTPAGDIIAQSLIYIYQILLKNADDRPSQVKLHFNIAETYYLQKKNYDQATYHYQWVVDNGKTDPSSKSLVDQAQFKLILSRYEALVAKQVFPKEVVAQRMDKVQAQSLIPEAAQWVTWVDKFFIEKKLDSVEVFMFESARLLYAHGQIKESFEVLNHLMELKPNSKFATPASSLILDTYVSSERWQDAYNQATLFLKRLDTAKPNQNKAEFRNRLQAVAMDSYFKMIEVQYKQGHYPETIHQADLFIQQYPHSPKRLDAMAIAGNAALAMKDKTKAMTYFNPLVKEKYSGKTIGTAYLTTATSSEEKLDFDAASLEYLKYISLPPAQREMSAKEYEDLKSKVLVLAWASGHSNTLKQILGTQGYCTPDLAPQCDKFKAYLELISSNPSPKTALDRWRKSRGPDRVIWGTILLQNPKALTLNDRITLLDSIGNDWNSADSLMKYALLSHLSTSIPQNIAQCAADVRKNNPLQLDKNRINARVGWIQKVEATVQKVLILPWARIRAGSLNEWANLYSHFAEDITALPRPKDMSPEDAKSYDGTVNDLISPFTKKSAELRKRALDTATESAIESEVYFPIALAAYRETPTLPAELRPDRPLGVHNTLFLEAVKNAGIEPSWLVQVNQAVADRNFIKLSFLVQYAQNKKLLNPNQAALLQALSLVNAGAQAEGIAATNGILAGLEGNTKKYLLLALALDHYGVRGKDKSRTYLEQFLAATNSSDRKALLTASLAADLFDAYTWTDAKPNDLKEELTELKESAPAAPPEVNP